MEEGRLTKGAKDGIREEVTEDQREEAKRDSPLSL